MKPEPDPAGFDVRWGSSTHPGLQRAENEDSLLARPPIFLVADGMGGHEQGRQASVEVVAAFDRSTQARWLNVESLEAAAALAAQHVQALSDGAPDPPGSTVTGVGATFHDGVPCWLVFNIGDSRTYRLQGGRLEQITVDHSHVQELVDSGLSLAQARSRVASNVITRAIGGGLVTAPDVDQWILPARSGDRLLVCSDGLTDEVGDDDIAVILREQPDPSAAAANLVECALDGGGRDNVTAIVIDAVRVDGEGPDWSSQDATMPMGLPILSDRTVPDLPIAVSTSAEQLS